MKFIKMFHELNYKKLNKNRYSTIYNKLIHIDKNMIKWILNFTALKLSTETTGDLTYET